MPERAGLLPVPARIPTPAAAPARRAPRAAAEQAAALRLMLPPMPAPMRHSSTAKRVPTRSNFLVYSDNSFSPPAGRDYFCRGLFLAPNITNEPVVIALDEWILQTVPCRVRKSVLLSSSSSATLASGLLTMPISSFFYAVMIPITCRYLLWTNVIDEATSARNNSSVNAGESSLKYTYAARN